MSESIGGSDCDDQNPRRIALCFKFCTMFQVLATVLPIDIVLMDTFFLGRLGEVAASASLTQGFNGPMLFVIILSVHDVMQINIIILKDLNKS